MYGRKYQIKYRRKSLVEYLKIVALRVQCIFVFVLF